MAFKKILKITAAAALIIPAPLTISCTLFGQSSDQTKSDLEFWNYEQYMTLNMKNNIDQVYRYREFGDLPELELQLNSNRIVGGVGTDYYIVNLAQKGLIAKIDFNQVFPDLGDNRAQWASRLEQIYTKSVWKVLNAFTMQQTNQNGQVIFYLDQNQDAIPDRDQEGNLKLWNNKYTQDQRTTNSDLDGDGRTDYVWEYTIPYFIQNKVVAFNVGKRLDQLHQDVTKMPDHVYQILKSDDLIAIQNLFSDKTYNGIFKQLSSWGYNSLEVNDYLRDNMIIGSEELSTTNPPTPTGRIAPGDYQTAITQIDSFIKLVNKYFPAITYETDGTTAFESIMDKINGQISNRDVALLYNGDAFDAANGSDNGKPNTIRVVIPRNSSFALDGVVLAQKIANDSFETQRFYRLLREHVFKGYNTSASFNGFTGMWNTLYQNWNGLDGIGYTPAYASLLDYAINKAQLEPLENFLVQTVAVANQGNPISDQTIPQPISSELQTRLEHYYLENK